jgi:hypothetical protein
VGLGVCDVKLGGGIGLSMLCDVDNPLDVGDKLNDMGPVVPLYWQWSSGPVVQWSSGPVVQWSMVQWSSGGLVQWSSTVKNMIKVPLYIYLVV